MVDGRKCSGYAKRVWKDRLMVHGTLMFDVDLETLQEVLSVPGSKMAASGIASVRSKVANLREYLPQFCDVLALKDALNRILAGADTEVPMDASKQEAIDRMADEKFRTWDWIYGKSPEAQFRASQKFACGTVEVCWSVHHGLLENVRFSGDFLGNLPAEGLAARLNGLRYEQNSISAALNGAGVSDYFDGLGPDELTELLICC
jgi:lipoate-protein ligase A